MITARRVVAVLAMLCLAAALFSQESSPPASRRGKIVVHISGFRSDKGHARIGLFNRANGFPMDSVKALTGARVEIHDHQASVEFSDLPYGTYGVIAHHDENDNYKLDVNWFDKPKELYGASNNPRPRLGPPRWKDSKFELKSDSVVVEIKLHK